MARELEIASCPLKKMKLSSYIYDLLLLHGSRLGPLLICVCTPFSILIPSSQGRLNIFFCFRFLVFHATGMPTCKLRCFFGCQRILLCILYVSCTSLFSARWYLYPTVLIQILFSSQAFLRMGTLEIFRTSFLYATVCRHQNFVKPLRSCATVVDTIFDRIYYRSNTAGGIIVWTQVVDFRVDINAKSLIDRRTMR